MRVLLGVSRLELAGVYAGRAGNWHSGVASATRLTAKGEGCWSAGSERGFGILDGQSMDHEQA
jgi:hypothetical protein